MVATINLRNELPDSEVDKLSAELLDDEHYDQLVTSDCDVYKPNGEVLLKYRRDVLPREACQAAYVVLRGAAKKTLNRGMAAGKIDPKRSIVHQNVGAASKTRGRRLKRDGTLTRTTESNGVWSGLVGFADRNSRFPYCRMTAFNIDHYQEFVTALPFVYAVNEVFKQNAPDRYQQQMAMIERTTPDFYIKNTVFTTITVNRNFRTAVHKDAGDLKEGFGVMSVLEGGRYDGGFLCFPKYRVAVDMRTGGVCLADVHEWHGNTPLIGEPGQFERVSCVFYYRALMYECGTVEYELERAKTLRTLRALDGEEYE